MKEIIMTGYTLTSEDGALVRMEETPGRERIVLSLTKEGRTETAVLNKSMFEGLMELRYNLKVFDHPTKEGGKEE